MALFFLIVAGFIGYAATLDAGPNGNYTGSCLLHPLFSRFDFHSVMCIPDHVKAFKFGDRLMITYYEGPLDSSIKWEFALWAASFELLFLARFEKNQFLLQSNEGPLAFNSQLFITHQTIPFTLPKGPHFRIYLENTKDGLALHTLNGHESLMHLPNGAKPFALFKHVTPHPESDYKYFSVSKPKEIAPKTFTVHYDDVVFSPVIRRREFSYEKIEYTNTKAPYG